MNSHFATLSGDNCGALTHINTALTGRGAALLAPVWLPTG
jgi:hypothetical protein